MFDTKLGLYSMWAIMAGVFCIVGFGAIAIAPAFTSAPTEGVGAMLEKPFDNPEDIGNSVQTFLVAMGGALAIGLLMGGFLRWILKKEIKVAVRVIVSICVFMILSVTFAAIATTVWGTSLGPWGWGALAVALVVTVLQYVYPEYWVIDVVSILAAVGISALIGSSLGIVPAVILLILFSTYDFIAVLCTGWMKKMAQGSADLKLPSMFILPYDLRTSYLSSTLNMGDSRKNFLILGTGDLVFPTVLAVSATFAFSNSLVSGSIMICIVVAYSVMYGMLKGYPEKFKLLPGLPFLCGGAIFGMILSCFLLGISWL